MVVHCKKKKTFLYRYYQKSIIFKKNKECNTLLIYIFKINIKDILRIYLIYKIYTSINYTFILRCCTLSKIRNQNKHIFSRL